jgi:hypothetical protein
MFKTHLFQASGLAGLIFFLLTGCQTTYSALPASSGYSLSGQAAAVAPRTVPAQPETLFASASDSPILAVRRHSAAARPVGTRTVSTAFYASPSVSGLQALAPDTVIQTTQSEAPHKFGVTQGAHVAGGLLILAGGITAANGFGSDSSGYLPLATVILGIGLAIVGGAMLLFKGKTARRKKQA